MDDHLVSKLRKLDSFVPMRNGDEGVPVSLQYRVRLKGLKPEERISALQIEFAKVAKELGSLNIEIDLNSISFLGQTVSAVIPLSCFDEVDEQLKTEDIRVDVSVEETVI